MKKFLKIILWVTLAILIFSGLYLWSMWPWTTRMDEKWIRWRLDAALPISEPVTDWEKRGEYVATVAGCGMCHTPYSWIGPHGNRAFQGGMRVRWENELGERVALNLTPDPETGLGRWTEEPEESWPVSRSCNLQTQAHTSIC